MKENGTDRVIPIVWSRQKSIGNDLIDRDHKYMISLFNSIELVLGKPDVRPHLPMFFDQLVEYTQEHFQREEDIQIRIDYPNYASHKLEHEKIMAHLESVNRQISRIAASAVDIQDASPYHEMLDGGLMSMARHWVIDHMLKADRDLVPYLENHPSRLQ